ncbi:MAG: DUF2835 domain-containing protein [Gammaproteobacteria bacterium]
MYTLTFSLYLSAEQYLAYYRGYARQVSVLAEDGRRLEFPAEHLRPYLTHEGIRGRFSISFDTQHRFVALQRC